MPTDSENISVIESSYSALKEDVLCMKERGQVVLLYDFNANGNRFITPRVCGGVKRLVLSVCPSVRPSVCPSVVCPLKNRAISRFTGLNDC